MLTILGQKSRYCDGLSRRSFLQIGALAMGGLSLPTLLKAQEQSGTRSNKAIIMVYLSGGLSHHDTFDLKPDATDEIRGEFRPIATRVPGIQISEYLPRLASMMDKLAVVRSIVGLRDEHSSFHTLTGYGMDITRRENKPNVCSVISKVMGRSSPVIPAYVDLFPTMQHRPYNIPGPGFAGPAHAGAKVENDQINLMRLSQMSQEEFTGRRQLLESIDQLRRSMDGQPMERMDISYRQAFEVLTSNRLVDALDRPESQTGSRSLWLRLSRHQGDGVPLERSTADGVAS